MRIGIDVGGTKIEIVALDGADRVVLRRRVPTPAHSYAQILEAIHALVVVAERDLGMRASVGVGHPGVVSPASGLIKNANSTVLIGKPFGRDLEVLLDRPLRLANDANCLALSEAFDGAAAGAHAVFGVIAGTGVGGGIAIDGVPLAGVNAIAGEWGHNPLPWPRPDELPGPPCYCGKRGCIETWLSGPGLAADFARVTGRALDAPQIVAASAAGDAEAAAALARHAERFARSLATVVNVLDPDVIVLGGGLSNVPGLCSEIVELWTDYVFSDVVATRVVTALHGDSSGVLGAARLWPSASPPA
jgi:fructokinase